MAKETIVNEKPIITIINLSKYITADSRKKERILKKLKFSESPKFARYSSPKSAISHYLKDEGRNALVFDEFIKKEKERVLDTPFKITDNRCCLEALNILKAKSKKLFAPYNNDYTKKGLKKQYTHVLANGVDVSLSPDIVFYNQQSNKIIGFIKLNFAKDVKERINYTQGQLITGLIKDHLEEQFQTKFDRKMCIAIDIFGERVIYAPEDITWRKDRPKLNIAFKEIAEVWPNLSK